MQISKASKKVATAYHDSEYQSRGNNTSGRAAFSGAHKALKHGYNYVDFETVGKMGAKDFGITEMSVRNSKTGALST
jgi:hypothetical protein